MSTTSNKTPLDNYPLDNSSLFLSRVCHMTMRKKERTNLCFKYCFDNSLVVIAVKKCCRDNDENFTRSSLFVSHSTINALLHATVNAVYRNDLSSRLSLRTNAQWITYLNEITSDYIAYVAIPKHRSIASLINFKRGESINSASNSISSERIINLRGKQRNEYQLHVLCARR